MRFKKEIIDASKYLLRLQFNIGSEGNISYRQKNEIYITPSGIKTSNLEPKDSQVSSIKYSLFFLIIDFNFLIFVALPKTWTPIIALVFFVIFFSKSEIDKFKV